MARGCYALSRRSGSLQPRDASQPDPDALQYHPGKSGVLAGASILEEKFITGSRPRRLIIGSVGPDLSGCLPPPEGVHWLEGVTPGLSPSGKRRLRGNP